MNLLKAGFNGKVGSVYGVTANGKKIAKAVPFSHAPHNNKQKAAFSAFGQLIRFSSPIAKNFFYPLFKTVKGQTKLNSVCSQLKPLLQENQFSFANLEDVFPSSENILIDLFVADDAEGETHLVVENNFNVQKGLTAPWYVGLYLPSGKCVFSLVPESREVNIILRATNYDPSQLVCVVIAAAQENRGKMRGYSAWDTPQIV